MPRIAIVAGEPSGDRLGAGLIRAVGALRPDVRFEGIAGPEMVAAGCEPWRDSEELAVMGLAEVVRHLPRLRRIIHDTRARIARDPPAALVGIDAPDFNLRVEPAARRAGVPTVHYVSPSVWAWRQGRVKTLQRACDLVLCLLPFEAEFLQSRGVSAEFVGHPLADEIPTISDPVAARESLGITGGPVIGLLPGSRVGEVSRLGPPFAATAAWLAKRDPGLRFAAPMATPTVAALFRDAIARHAPGCEIILVDGRAREVLAASDAVLVASGTATLETMLVDRPMVVAYRLAPLTYRLLRSTGLVKVPHFSLPNLLAGRQVVHEFLQDEVAPAKLGPAILELARPGPARDRMLAAFAPLRGQLRRNASEQAARAVLRIANLL